MPVIILEGVDGSGKSTLATKLFGASPVPTTLLHRGPMQGTVEEEYIYPLNTLQPGRLLIADRWHVGEMIYGPIYRGKSLVAGDYNLVIEKLLSDMNAVKVMVSPPVEVVKARLDHRGEDYLKPEHVDEVHAFYERYAIEYGYRLIREVTDTTVQELLTAALEG